MANVFTTACKVLLFSLGVVLAGDMLAYQFNALDRLRVPLDYLLFSILLAGVAAGVTSLLLEKRSTRQKYFWAILLLVCTLFLLFLLFAGAKAQIL
jgi:hypothetical protein